jgi:glycosyltransferase involved in cell wall biosynthesis
MERVLEGVRNLEPRPSQVLIIDDASSDGSTELIGLLIARDPCFELIVNKHNQGQSYSRNIGVGLSKNDLIIFQDDDDISLPTRPKAHLHAFEQGADFSYVSSRKTYPNGYSVSNINSEYCSDIKYAKNIIRHLVVGKELPLDVNVSSPSSTLAVRKSAFKSLNGFDVKLRRLEDIDLACRALDSGFTLAWSSEILVNRFHTQGDDKSPDQNMLGELHIINSMKDNLSWKDYFVAREMTRIRAHYFEKNYINLVKDALVIPIIIILSPKKILSIVKRFRHDLRQGE